MNYPYYLPQNGNPYMNNFQSPMQQRLQNMEQQQFMPQQPQNLQPPSNGILWVQGAEGAKSYMLAPNSTVLLMDSEGTRFYIKSTDAAGMPSMRTFEFREVTGLPSSTQSTEDFVRRTEFDTLKSKMEQYDSILSSLMSPVPSSSVPNSQQNKQQKEAN